MTGLYLAGLGARIGTDRLSIADAVEAGRYSAESARADGYVALAREPALAPYEMALVAAREAMDQAGVTGSDLGGVVYASIHRHGQPRLWAPGAWLQRHIGARGGMPVLSVQQGCNGLVQALHFLAPIVRTAGRPVLFAGADRYEGSGFDRWNSDYGLLYGDAAAAFVLSPDRGCARVLHVDLDGAPELEELHRDEAPSEEGPASGIFEYDVRRSKKAFLARHGQEGFAGPLTAALRRLRERLLASRAWTGPAAWMMPPFVGSKHREPTYEAAFADLGRRSGWEIGKGLGHLGTTDAWVALSEGLRSGAVARGERVLVVSAGVGFSCGLVLLEIL